MHQSTATGFNRHWAAGSGLLVALVLLGACASAPPPAAPTEALTAAQEAIASAEQADARQYAGAELDEAREKLDMAERAVSAEDMIGAERLAEQSRVAAELASARTEAAKAEEVNREMGRGAEALIEEMRRTGDRQ